MYALVLLNIWIFSLSATPPSNAFIPWLKLKIAYVISSVLLSAAGMKCTRDLPGKQPSGLLLQKVMNAWIWERLCFFVCWDGEYSALLRKGYCIWCLLQRQSDCKWRSEMLLRWKQEALAGYDEKRRHWIRRVQHHKMKKRRSHNRVDLITRIWGEDLVPKLYPEIIRSSF